MHLRLLPPTLAVIFLVAPCAMGQTVSTITSEFDASGDVKVGPDGNIYVADFGVALGDANGTVVYRVTPSGNIITFATGLVGASGNVFDDNGNLFQSNIAANRVSKITPAGVVTTYASGGGIFQPTGLAIDAAGNLYNGNCVVSGSGRISITTPGGVTSTFVSDNLLLCPNGLTIDDDDNLYASNFTNGRIIKVTPDGVTSILATINSSFRNGHITFANGRLYVCNWSGRIYEVTLDGEARVLAGTGVLGTDDGPANQATFFRPNGISATVTGDTLYINQSTEVVPTGNPQLHPNVVRMITGVLATVGVEDVPSEVPDGLGLEGSRPNPFSESTQIVFNITDQQPVTLRVYDVLGRLVRTLLNEAKPVGRHSVMWDGRDAAGFTVASGVYLYALESESRRDTRNLLVVR